MGEDPEASEVSSTSCPWLVSPHFEFSAPPRLLQVFAGTRYRRCSVFTLRLSDVFLELVGADPPIAADAKRAGNLALVQQAIKGLTRTAEKLGDLIHRHYRPKCHFCLNTGCGEYTTEPIATIDYF